MRLKDAIEAVIDDALDDISSCAIMTGYQARENCDLKTTTCDYRELCKKIFEKEKEE